MTGSRWALLAAALAALGAAFGAQAAEPATGAPVGAMTGGALGALLTGTGTPTLVELVKDLVPKRWFPDGISPAANIFLSAAVYVLAAWIMGEDPVTYVQQGLAIGGVSTAGVSGTRISRVVAARRRPRTMSRQVRGTVEEAENTSPTRGNPSVSG